MLHGLGRWRVFLVLVFVLFIKCSWLKQKLPVVEVDL